MSVCFSLDCLVQELPQRFSPGPSSKLWLKTTRSFVADVRTVAPASEVVSAFQGAYVPKAGEHLVTCAGEAGHDARRPRPGPRWQAGLEGAPPCGSSLTRRIEERAACFWLGRLPFGGFELNGVGTLFTRKGGLLKKISWAKKTNFPPNT